MATKKAPPGAAAPRGPKADEPLPLPPGRRAATVAHDPAGDVPLGPGELSANQARALDAARHVDIAHKPMRAACCVYLVIKRDGTLKGFCYPNEQEARDAAAGQAGDDMSSCVLRVDGVKLLEGEEPFSLNAKLPDPEPKRRRPVIDDTGSIEPGAEVA